MILGIGIDLVDVASYREKVYAPDPQSYLDHHFSQKEQALIIARREADPVPLYAARWAAKEAFIKAINGPDLHKQEMWLDHFGDIREIQVLCDQHERPYLELIGLVAKAAEKKSIKRMHLSMTHEGNYASAMVILEG